jgi:hypothetical protein
MRHAYLVNVVAAVSLVMVYSAGIARVHAAHQARKPPADPQMIVWTECDGFGTGSALFAAPTGEQPSRFEQLPPLSDDVRGVECEDHEAGGDDGDDGDFSAAKPTESGCESAGPARRGGPAACGATTE